MKEFFDNTRGLRFIQFSLIVGIIILASNNMDGWGWLVFLLLVTL